MLTHQPSTKAGQDWTLKVWFMQWWVWTCRGDEHCHLLHLKHPILISCTGRSYHIQKRAPDKISLLLHDEQHSKNKRQQLPTKQYLHWMKRTPLSLHVYCFRVLRDFDCGHRITDWNATVVWCLKSLNCLKTNSIIQSGSLPRSLTDNLHLK